ncbi:hypothetical protein BBC0122_000810 [Bartonella choladocola]|uniref:Uncharacterized protein n=1 Tax=Bartonella choladocola TaxID=2750995 RepID=A0A1U9MEV8_9HYPH|nr:hypothetical protein BBC0122_000810 [Bartonella choladocola]
MSHPPQTYRRVEPDFLIKGNPFYSLPFLPFNQFVCKEEPVLFFPCHIDQAYSTRTVSYQHLQSVEDGGNILRTGEMVFAITN